jgi:hypothetical protein
MEHDSCDLSNNTPILFGRPFLKTTNTKIDCGKDTFLFFIKCKKYIDQKVRLAGKPANQKYRCTEQACGIKLPANTRNTA